MVITTGAEEPKEVTEQVAVPTVTEPPKEDVITDILKRLSDSEKAYKDVQKVISRKDQEINKLKDEVGYRDRDRRIVDLVAERVLDPEVKAQLDLALQEGDRDKQRRQIEARVDSIQKRVTDLGLTDKDRKYWEIRKAVREGDFDAAEFEVTDLEKSKAEVTKTKEPVTPQRDVDKEIDEGVRQELEKRGILKTDLGTPAGSSGRVWTMAEVLAIPPRELAKHFPGGYAEIQEKVNSGQIKV